MDQDLKKLLHTILGTDPEAPLDDDTRRALMYSMLGQAPNEHFPAILEFANTITDEFRRSYLLHNLVTHSAERILLLLDFSIQVARSIPIPYWRLSALNHVAAEMLRRHREFSTIEGVKSDLGERAEQLLMEIEKSLPLASEEDDERKDQMWRAALSMISAGKLEWAESLAQCTEYCTENADILLRVAKERASRGEAQHVVRLAQTVANLARTGSDDLTNRAWDLEGAAKLMFGCGDKQQARECLDESVKYAVASQEAHDIDGSKCLAGIAETFAEYGYMEKALETANRVTQPARRERARQNIEKIFLSK